MTAHLTTHIVWTVTWDISEPGWTGATYGLYFHEAEDAAEHVRILEANDAENVRIDRVEVADVDDPIRGVLAGSEWLANDGERGGDLWERVAENHTPNESVVTQPQWERMNSRRNALGTRNALSWEDPRGPLATGNPVVKSGSIVAGLLIYRPLSARKIERRAFERPATWGLTSIDGE